MAEKEKPDVTRGEIAAALREGARYAAIDGDSDDRITREIAMGVSAALERVAGRLEGHVY